MNNDTFRLLVKKISNEITEDENSQISTIIENDSEIATEYDRLKIIWADTGNLNNVSNENSNFEKTNAKIVVFKQLNRKKILKTSFQYAAIFTVIFFSLGFIFTYKKTVTLSNNTDIAKTITLPDNSVITLDTNSYLTFQTSLFRKFNREINFYGKGFFNIQKNPNKKFIVHSDNFDIQVFGTKFNVDLHNNKKTVVLVEGKVLMTGFTSNEDTSIVMQPGDLVEYHTTTGKIILNPTNPEVYTYWLNDKIVFDNFTINELIDIFRIYYRKTLVFDDTTLKNKQIGGSAPTDDLSLIINALSFITNKDAIQKNDTIYFK